MLSRKLSFEARKRIRRSDARQAQKAFFAKAEEIFFGILAMMAVFGTGVKWI